MNEVRSTMWFLAGILAGFWIDDQLAKGTYRRWVENLPVKIERKENT